MRILIKNLGNRFLKRVFKLITYKMIKNAFPKLVNFGNAYIKYLMEKLILFWLFAKYFDN